MPSPNPKTDSAANDAVGAWDGAGMGLAVVLSACGLETVKRSKSDIE